MTIIVKSPNLAGALRRRFPHLDLAPLDKIFDLAIDCGGLEEVDFDREPGSSYNPRPARIALILLQDAKVADPEVIAASMAASVWPAIEERGFRQIASPRIARLVDDYRRLLLLMEEPQEPSSIAEEQRATAKIILAVHLDRARHLHLSNKADWPEFLELTKRHIALAEEICPSLHVLLNAWLARSERQLKMRQRKNND